MWYEQYSKSVHASELLNGLYINTNTLCASSESSNLKSKRLTQYLLIKSELEYIS